MKTRNPIAVLGLTLILAGCATSPKLVLDRVGPSTELAPTKSNHGNLVVYSAGSPTMNLVDPDTVLFTDYTVRSNDGAVYRQVRNWVSKLMREPATVALPAGDYTVEAESSCCGTVRVPVLVEASRTTTVYLDGESRPGFKGFEAASLVSLPDGYVVGLRAK